MTFEPSPADEAALAERRAARNAVKLAALVRDRWGIDATASGMGTGASMATGGTSYVLLDGDLGLGAALLWSRRAGTGELHVLVDDRDVASTIARQAAEFRSAISVWQVQGRTLHPAVATPLPPTEPPPDAPELVAVLTAAGLDVVVEGDRLAGEFRGLEVARIVRAVDDGTPVLEVGVGKYDRALTAMMHGDMDARASIGRVVDQLRELRRPGGPNHPLATLVPERWLRATLLHEPGLIGCDSLAAAPAAAPRDRLRPRAVAVATGVRGEEPVVVVCSVGVDVEAPVQAADSRLALDPDATLLYVVPSRDVLPVVRVVVDDLVRPAEVVGFEPDWRR